VAVTCVLYSDVSRSNWVVRADRYYVRMKMGGTKAELSATGPRKGEDGGYGHVEIVEMWTFERAYECASVISVQISLS